jgi:hypothetical protein
MKYELVTHMPNDGWSYIRVDGNLYLIYPPFSEDLCSRKASDSDIDSSIRFGFALLNKPFDNADDLLRYIKDEYTKHIDPSILNISNDELLDKFIRVASPDDVEYFLQLIETELIPNGKHEAASRLRDKLSKLNKI